jgi:hypothetical protein
MPSKGNALRLESGTRRAGVSEAPKGSWDVAVGDSPPISCPQQSISRESGAGSGRYHRGRHVHESSISFRVQYEKSNPVDFGKPPTKPVLVHRRDCPWRGWHADMADARAYRPSPPASCWPQWLSRAATPKAPNVLTPSALRSQHQTPKASKQVSTGQRPVVTIMHRASEPCKGGTTAARQTA